MKFYKERFVDSETGDEVRVPIFIDEGQLRKADFHVNYEEVENDTVPIPAGFPRNYPKNDIPKKNTHLEKRYTVDFEFRDGAPLQVVFKDRKLWEDCIKVVTGCEAQNIFGFDRR